MRTIQEYLKEADMDRLVKEFFKTHPAKYESEDRMNLSVRQIRENMENHLVEYIHRLQSIKILPSEDKKEAILFAHKYLHDGIADVAYSLLHEQELLEKGTEASTYAYEFCSQAEIMGYLVSDADLTQKNIYGLMVDVMWEASFFGYEEEELENERKKLEETITEAESGKVISTTIEELFGEREEQTDELEEQLYHKCMDAAINYDGYCKKKEMEILRQLLLGKANEKEAAFCRMEELVNSKKFTDTNVDYDEELSSYRDGKYNEK
jgi:hypothetical protein